MLIEFSIKNWKSFRDKSKLSFVAGEKGLNKRQIPVVNRYGLNLLPVAAIFGGNASGKSNLVEALKFARRMVVQGTEIDGEILVDPFLKDDDSENKGSYFNFKLLINKEFFSYEFTVNKSRVLDEKLSLVSKDGTEEFLFKRNKSGIDISGINFDAKKLEILKKFTRKEQLFLSNTISLNIGVFRPVYNWFKDSLGIIQPETQFRTLLELLDQNDDFMEYLNETLYYFDTGITKIVKKPLRPEIVEALYEERNSSKLRKNGVSVRIRNGKPEGSRLITQYERPSGKIVNFPLQKESEGTRRLIDLLPTFFDLTSKTDPSVLVIDEIDRSLHSHLTQSLISSFLGKTGKSSRIQLIFTTHDLSLLDPEILRSDETWLTQRNGEGCTNLYSVGDFRKESDDQNIFDRYELGVLGGTPNLLYRNGSPNPFDKIETEEE